MGTLPLRPDVRHVFRVQDASTHNDTTPVSSECLSCNSSSIVTSTAAAESNQSHDDNTVFVCQYARASMSKDFSYYVLDCLGPTVPYSLLFSLPNNQLVKILDTNDDVKDMMNMLAQPKVKFMSYDDVLEEASASARVKLLIPPGFREEEQYTFPLVLRV